MKAKTVVRVVHVHWLETVFVCNKLKIHVTINMSMQLILFLFHSVSTSFLPVCVLCNDLFLVMK